MGANKEMNISMLIAHPYMTGNSFCGDTYVQAFAGGQQGGTYRGRICWDFSYPRINNWFRSYTHGCYKSENNRRPIPD